MIDPEYGTSYAARRLACAIGRDGDDLHELAEIIQAVIDEAIAEARRSAADDRHKAIGGAS